MIRSLFVFAFGRLIATPLGRWLLRQVARPHRDLHDLDGSLYMARWHVIDEGTLSSRVLKFFTGYASARMHRIMRPDHDRDLHNHPFTYRTFILEGFYTEEVEQGLFVVPAIRRFNLAVRGDSLRNDDRAFHRISQVSEGGVLTLFFMTPNKAHAMSTGWGFKVDGKYVESVRYLLRKGYKRDTVKAVQSQ